MAARLTSLGYARVFRHPRTGELAVDTDSLRRGGGFSGVDFGEDDFDGDEDWDDEDDDDEDDEFEGDDDFGYEDLEGDDFGDDDIEGEDDFGARGQRRRRRLNRRLNRLNRRESRIKRKLGKTGSGKSKGSKMRWGMTAVSGTDTLGAAGSASVKLRLQHHFKAHDITFTGSASGAKVTSIFFGDRVVWSSSDGIDVSVFGSTSLLRGLLKGQSLRAGLDGAAFRITVNGSLTGAGDFACTLIGQKPVNSSC